MHLFCLTLRGCPLIAKYHMAKVIAQDDLSEDSLVSEVLRNKLKNILINVVVFCLTHVLLQRWLPDFTNHALGLVVIRLKGSGIYPTYHPMHN